MAYLEGKGLELAKHDLAKDPPPRELLEQLIDDDDPSSFLNPRSPAYKERDLGSKKWTKAQVLKMVSEDPNLMRRPIVPRGKGRAILGFDPAQYDKIS